MLCHAKTRLTINFCLHYRYSYTAVSSSGDVPRRTFSRDEQSRAYRRTFLQAASADIQVRRKRQKCANPPTVCNYVVRVFIFSNNAAAITSRRPAGPTIPAGQFIIGSPVSLPSSPRRRPAGPALPQDPCAGFACVCSLHGLWLHVIRLALRFASCAACSTAGEHMCPMHICAPGKLCSRAPPSRKPVHLSSNREQQVHFLQVKVALHLPCWRTCPCPAQLWHSQWRFGFSPMARHACAWLWTG